MDNRLNTTPFTEASRLIDTDLNKKYELVHQRYFNNVSAATGWQEATDMIQGYMLDIELTIPEGEDDIDLRYSPEVIIPDNIDKTCRPNNFIRVRTIDKNTIRLYAREIPSAVNMLPITVIMRGVNTSEGTLNSGGYAPSEKTDINIEKTLIQIKGTSFMANVDENNYTVEETKIEMRIQAFKGEEEVNVSFGTLEGIDLLKNLDGTGIKFEDYGITYLADSMPGSNVNSALFTATLPKGVPIKDKIAYFQIPITTGANFWARATLYTNRSDETVAKTYRYELDFPNLTRSTGNNYLVNGEPTSVGAKVNARQIGVNGDTSAATGRLMIYGYTLGQSIEGDGVLVLEKDFTGSTIVEDLSQFNRFSDLRISFAVGQKIVYTGYTRIERGETDISIRTSLDYIIPTLNAEGSMLELPSVRVDLFSKVIGGFLEAHYGRIRVKDEADNLIIESSSPRATFLIPVAEYSKADMPSRYKIEVLDNNEIIRAVKLVSIVGEGDVSIPYLLEISPSTLIVPINESGELLGNPVFRAHMKQGNNDVSKEWTFEITYNSQVRDLGLTEELEPSGSHVYSVDFFTGKAMSAVITIEATNGTDSISRDLVLNKIIQREIQGTYTFIKYANLVKGVGDQPDRFEFTIDPNGVLEPGESLGDYYGMAITRVDRAPTNPNDYKWLDISIKPDNPEPVDPSIPVEPGVPDTPEGNFEIRGNNIINSFERSDGGISISPSNLELDLIADTERYVSGVHWQYRRTNNEEWQTIQNSEERLLSIELKKEMFNQQRVFFVRAIVESISDITIMYSHVHLPIFLTHAAEPEYIAQLITQNSESKTGYTFPVDRNGTAITGVGDRAPLILRAEVYKGFQELEYRPHDIRPKEQRVGTYTVVEQILHPGSFITEANVSNRLSLKFEELTALDGYVSVVIEVEGRERVEMVFNWNSKRVSNLGAPQVSISSNYNKFTNETAQYTDILEWPTYSQAYVNEFGTEELELILEPENTNISKVYIDKGSNNFTRFAAKMTYKNGQYQEITPINILNEDGESHLERLRGFVIPGEYYLLTSLGLIDGLAVDYVGNNDKFTIGTSFKIGSQNAIIIKTTPGSEEIQITRSIDNLRKISLYHFTPLESFITTLGDKFKNGLLSLDELTSEEENYLPTSVAAIDTLYEFKFKGGKNILSLNPQIAVSNLYFDNTKADTSSNIIVETITGERTEITISREVRPYREFSEYTKEMGELLSPNYIYRSGLRTILNSRDSLRMAKDELIKRVANDSVVIDGSEPNDGFIKNFYDPKRDPITLEVLEPKTYPLLIDERVINVGGVDQSSVFGISLVDKLYYLLEFYVKYDSASSATINYSIENHSLKEFGIESFESFQKNLIGGEWVKHKYLIPPAGSGANISEQLTSYLQERGLVNGATDYEVLFENRHEGREEHSAYYIRANMNEMVGDKLELKDVKLTELHPESESEVNVFREIRKMSVYEDFLTTTSYGEGTFFWLVDELENEFANKNEVSTSRFKPLYPLSKEIERLINEVEYQISVLFHKDFQNSKFQTLAENRKYTMGFVNSTGWLSSLQMTPDGTLIQGEKNRIIGSTSIGSLYGKKIVIGKEITPEDIKHDKNYYKGQTGEDGLIAVWDEDRWASTINKKGQYFYRYDGEGTSGSLVGYMVMNPHEIAAYQIGKTGTDFRGSTPPDMETEEIINSRTAAFKIGSDGQVSINNLSVNTDIDLVDTIRVKKYTSEGRVGVVFIGIGGNKPIEEGDELYGL